MHPKLLKAFETSELIRKDLIDMTRPFASGEKFLSKPEGKWSVSQILSHLIQAEALSLQYMKKKSLGIQSAGDTGILEELKFVFLKYSQRLPFKYKAPAVLGKSGPPEIEFSEIVDHWDKLRDEMFEFLQTIDNSHINRKIYKHAVAGRLNVIQAIKFFDEHLMHHRPQIKRLLQ